MSGFGRGALLALFTIAVAGLAAAAPARAQTAIDAGKTPPQLFASDCAVCHKSPQGLARSGPVFLQSFLRQHYTASRETAQALANYLGAVGDGRAKPKPAARPSKPREAKPADAKASAAKSGETMPAETKPAETKPAEAKAAEPKPAETKPAEAKPAEPKPAEVAPVNPDKSD